MTIVQKCAKNRITEFAVICIGLSKSTRRKCDTQTVWHLFAFYCFRTLSTRTELSLNQRLLLVARDSVNCPSSPLNRTAASQHFVVTLFHKSTPRLLNL